MARGKYPKKPKPIDYVKETGMVGAAVASAVVSTQGLVPAILGSGGLALLKFILTPSLEKRRDRWFEDLDSDLKKLEAKVQGLEENLREREDFSTVTIQATQIALRTNQKDKLRALRNTVLNCAVRPDKEDKAETFLNILDGLSGSHLLVLQQFLPRGLPYEIGFPLPYNADTEVYGPTLPFDSDGPIAQVAKGIETKLNLSAPFPPLDLSFIKQIVSELLNKGLIEESEENSGVAIPGTKKKKFYLSDFGREFLTFISTPKEIGD